MKKIVILFLVLSIFLITSCSQQKTMEDLTKNVDSMTQEEKRAAINEANKIQTTESLTETQMKETKEHMEAMSDSSSISSGTFEERFHSVEGSAKIIQKDGESFLVFSEDFKTFPGPSLHIILSSHNNPSNKDQVHQEPSLDLGKIEGRSGQQMYKIPSNYNPEDFKSAIIYCKPFKVIFALAMLS